MRVFARMLTAAVTAGVGMAAVASDGIEPVGGWQRKPAAPCPPAVAPAVPCPPAVPVAPPLGTPPMAMPPADPGQPPTPPTTDPAAPPPVTPPTDAPPAAAAPALPNAAALLATAPALGTGSGGTALPNVNGDLLGGGGVAGPIPVVVDRNNNILSPLPVVILANGQRLVVGAGPQLPTDELIRNRGTAGTSARPPGSRVFAFFPPKGAVFDKSQADLVARIPQVERGPFKVGENESPRPRTRFILSYYYYDQVFQPIGGADVPRMQVHQQVFGYEQAFMDGEASVGLRLPYNQVVSAGFYNDTKLGDLTLTSKYVLRENKETGSLLSAGLLLTTPTGNRAFASTITGDEIGGVLIQPYLGAIYRRDRVYLQGFSSIVVPTDDRDVTLLTNGGQLGYVAYTNPGAWISSVVPTFELHVNTPLDHRGRRAEPVGFVDQVTALGGLQLLIRERSGLGFSVGSPVTGPRPFSLQATLQANFWF